MDKLCTLAFKQQLEGLGLNLKSLESCGGILAGTAVYEFFLYQKGILSTYSLSSFEIYSTKNYTGMKPGKLFQAHIHPKYKIGKSENIQSLFINNYPLNFEQVAFYDDTFVYSKDFENLIQTRQIQVTYNHCSEYETVCKLMMARDRYKNQLFLNVEKEFYKISITTELIKGSSKYQPVYLDNKAYLDRFFSTVFKKGDFFLKGKKNQWFKLIPKKHEFRQFKKHVFEFWDEIYGGASKLMSHNYQLLKSFYLGLEFLFSKEAYKKLKKQLAISDIRIIAKYLKLYALDFLIDKEDIEKTIERFGYLKLLEEDYGINIILLLESNKNPNLESVHEDIIKDWQKLKKPLIGPIKFSKSFLNMIMSKNCGIRELISKMDLNDEGRIMHHCVGNYESRVSSGRCRIFSIYTLDKKERSTLEIQIGSKNEWYVSQNKSYYNRLPAGDLISLGKDLCDYINQKEKILKK